MTTKPWTAARLAERLRALADEHGVPNRFHLHEVADQVAGEVLAVSRVARLEGASVNDHLKPHGYVARYEARSSSKHAAVVMRMRDDTQS